MASGFKAESTGSFSTPSDDTPTVAMIEAAVMRRSLEEVFA